MLLAVDVGNTQILIALYDDASAVEIRDHWRLATSADRTSDEYAVLVRQLLGDVQPEGIAISSVVPRATAALRSMSTKYFKIDPVVVEPGTKTGMPIHIDNPREVGADRIVNAIGAYDLFGGPTIVVEYLAMRPLRPPVATTVHSPSSSSMRRQIPSTWAAKP